MTPMLNIAPDYPLGVVPNYDHVEVSGGPVYLRTGHHERGVSVFTLSFPLMDQAEASDFKATIAAARGGRFMWTPPGAVEPRTYEIVDPNVQFTYDGPHTAASLTVREDL